MLMEQFVNSKDYKLSVKSCINTKSITIGSPVYDIRSYEGFDNTYVYGIINEIYINYLKIKMNDYYSFYEQTKFIKSIYNDRKIIKSFKKYDGYLTYEQAELLVKNSLSDNKKEVYKIYVEDLMNLDKSDNWKNIYTIRDYFNFTEMKYLLSYGNCRGIYVITTITDKLNYDTLRHIFHDLYLLEMMDESLKTIKIYFSRQDIIIEFKMSDLIDVDTFFNYMKSQDIEIPLMTSTKRYIFSIGNYITLTLKIINHKKKNLLFEDLPDIRILTKIIDKKEEESKIIINDIKFNIEISTLKSLSPISYSSKSCKIIEEYDNTTKQRIIKVTSYSSIILYFNTETGYLFFNDSTFLNRNNNISRHTVNAQKIVSEWIHLNSFSITEYISKENIIACNLSDNNLL
ncbi:MAG: hypothetical protein Q8J85_07180 [Sulfuricurvum sp.]|nr:hypothetical protein [Sulfuricurvum sp.]MDP3022991.1 hypothetical protein [Sulfuricurvum sp.]